MSGLLQARARVAREDEEALQEEGKLRVVGIIEERHPDRTCLFMQWKQMDSPLLHDPLNLLDVEAVPLTYLVDERGVVRYEKPSDDDLRALLATEYGPPAAEPRDLVPEPGSAEHVLLWEGDASTARAIQLLEAHVNDRPVDPRAQFRLGVAYRRRYDSDDPERGDFQKAVEHWGKALDLDPNQYIFRRRIQQYGPRLDKPYPFYDWVSEAREAILAQGRRRPLYAWSRRGRSSRPPFEELPVDGETSQPDPQGRTRSR